LYTIEGVVAETETRDEVAWEGGRGEGGGTFEGRQSERVFVLSNVFRKVELI